MIKAPSLSKSSWRAPNTCSNLPKKSLFYAFQIREKHFQDWFSQYDDKEFRKILSGMEKEVIGSQDSRSSAYPKSTKTVRLSRCLYNTYSKNRAMLKRSKLSVYRIQASALIIFVRRPKQLVLKVHALQGLLLFCSSDKLVVDKWCRKAEAKSWHRLTLSMTSSSESDALVNA